VSVKYSVKNNVIRVVIVCALTFKGSMKLTYSHKAVLFYFKKQFKKDEYQNNSRKLRGFTV